MNPLYDPYMVSFALAIQKLPSDVLVRMSEEIDKLLQQRYDSEDEIERMRNRPQSYKRPDRD